MVFNLFRGKSKVGIDIGTSAIKVAELSQENGRFKLENYGIFGPITGTGDQEIIQALKDVMATAGIKSRDVVASVSAFSTFATVIEMPYVSEEDLAKTIPFEARKYIPVPLDQVILDWSIVGVAPTPTPGAKTSVEVFLAAVPKDETARYQRIFAGAGLNLVALELENSSLIRGLLGNDLSPTAIVNIGGRSTSIIIVAKGYERLSHNYEIGGYEMTKAIANSLHVGADEAEALKRKYGLVDSPENKIRPAILSLVDMMIFEARKTIETYEQSRGQHISRLVVVGGLANMPGLAQYMKQRMDRDVLVGNVFARLVYPQELTPIAQTLSNTLAVAVGAAMRET